MPANFLNPTPTKKRSGRARTLAQILSTDPIPRAALFKRRASFSVFFLVKYVARVEPRTNRQEWSAPCEPQGSRCISTRRMQGGVLSKYPSGDSEDEERWGTRACVITLRHHRRRHGDNRTSPAFIPSLNENNSDLELHSPFSRRAYERENGRSLRALLPKATNFRSAKEVRVHKMRH